MSSLVYLILPKTKRLTTYSRLSGYMSAPPDQTLTNNLIGIVSEVIARELGYEPYRGQIQEVFAGEGINEVLTDIIPVAKLDSVSYDGDALDTDEYWLDDPAIGFITFNYGLMVTVQPLWSLIYWGGWITPADELAGSTAVSVTASTKKYTLSSGSWPLLIPGEKITFSGFTEAANNGEKTVVTRSATELTVSETLADEAAGDQISTVCANLPLDLEYACILAVKSSLVGGAGSSTVQAQSIRISSELLVSYATSAVKQSEVQLILNKYKKL